jgi:hypothetical protein
MSLIAAYINTHQKENNNKQNRFAQLLNATCHQCHFNLPLMGQSSSKVGGDGQFSGSGSDRVANVLPDPDAHFEPAVLGPDPSLDATFLTLKLYTFLQFML